MRIRSVELENFGPHARTKVEFTHGINAIIGENGSGKTTILEGIAYALFPNVFRNQDELMKRDTRRMRVILEFEVNGRIYRVERIKERGSSGFGRLWEILEDGKAKLMMEEQSKVTKQIEGLLSIGRDVFLQAIYVRQGEIAALVEERPSERREIIGRLLGMEALERIWEVLKEVIRDLDVKIEGLRSKVEEMQNLERDLKLIEEKIVGIKEELEALGERKKELEASIARLRDRLKELEALERRYNSLMDRLEMLRREERKLSDSMRTREEKIKGLKARLKDYEALREQSKDYEKLLELKEKVNEIEVLKRKTEELESLINRISRLPDLEEEFERVQIALKDLNSRLKDAEEKFRELVGSRSALKEVESRIEQISEQIESMRSMVDSVVSAISNLIGRRAAVDEVAAVLRNELDRLTEELGRVEDGISRIKERLSSLRYRERQLESYLSDMSDEVERCPLCGSLLSPDRIEELREHLKNELNGVRGEIRRLESELDVLEGRRKKVLSVRLSLLRPEIVGVEAIIRDLRKLEEELRQLELKREDLKRKILELSGAEKEVERLQEELRELRAREAVLSKELGEVRSLDSARILEEYEAASKALAGLKNEVTTTSSQLGLKNLSELTYRLERTKKARNRLKELEELSEQLRKEEGVLSELKLRMNEIRIDIERVERLLEELGFDKAEMLRLRRELEAKEEELRNISSEIGAKKGELRALETRRGEIRTRLESLRREKEKLKSLEDFRRKLERVRRLFHKSEGVQPLIRERARPAIEEEMDRIFSSFNFNYDSLSLDEDFTPKLRRGGEVFEYHRLSGGERIALALALRLAIARYLMASKVETLIVDEPTVHLDRDRIGALIEALSSLEIPQLIVVTHSERFKEVANRTILVRKEGDTSRVSLVEGPADVID